MTLRPGTVRRSPGRPAPALTLATLAAAWAALGCATPAQARAPHADPIAPFVAATVTAGADDLSTRSEPESAGRLTWASWAEGVPPNRNVRLVLLQRARRNGSHPVRQVWGVLRPLGYAPVLYTTPWQSHGHYVLMLQFQYGAAYRRIELYAVRDRAPPAMLGSLEGSWIETVQDGPDETLRSHSSSDLKDPPRCHGWNPAANTLAERPC